MWCVLKSKGFQQISGASKHCFIQHKHFDDPHEFSVGFLLSLVTLTIILQVANWRNV